MLSKALWKQLKKYDIVNHPECSHNWVHNAGKQYEWDGADSRNIAYMYICTMCGGEFWSSNKCFKIPHYTVKEVKNA